MCARNPKEVDGLVNIFAFFLLLLICAHVFIITEEILNSTNCLNKKLEDEKTRSLKYVVN
jgi:hypothetical protein